MHGFPVPIPHDLSSPDTPEDHAVLVLYTMLENDVRNRLFPNLPQRAHHRLAVILVNKGQPILHRVRPAAFRYAQQPVNLSGPVQAAGGAIPRPCAHFLLGAQRSFNPFSLRNVCGDPTRRIGTAVVIATRTFEFSTFLGERGGSFLTRRSQASVP